MTRPPGSCTPSRRSCSGGHPVPNYTAAWGQIKPDAGLAMRFPRFTGRWRDDKAPEDATTTGELVELFLGARKQPTP